MAKVEIYSSMWCPYCSRAKRLLQSKGVDFVEYDLDEDPGLRSRMLERSGGARTVPQIFVDDRHVGGCDELYALDRSGKLDPMLQVAGQ